jgi:hypothetical protein
MGAPTTRSTGAARTAGRGTNQGLARARGALGHLMPLVEVPHPNTGSAASPEEIYEWVRSHVPPSAQAVFIGGNALRAIGVIAALEDDLRRPVLTANQVSLWYALRVAGAEVSIDGYGQLFKLPCRQSEIPSGPT